MGPNLSNRICLLVLTLTQLMLVTAVHAAPFHLAYEGQASACIYAPGENVWAGRRLADRIHKLTGVELQVSTDTQALAPELNVIIIGTLENNALLAKISGAGETSELGEEGYYLKTAIWNTRPMLIAGGHTLAGANNAVSELISWKLDLTERGASVDAALDEHDKPTLKYRIVWTWDGHLMWTDTLKEMQELYSPLTGSTVVPYSTDGFHTHMTRAIDYFSDHKLNGLIVWGFLRDEHGGVEMGREISRYAKQNNVRILPGVCSQAAYGGFIFSATNEYTLDVRGKAHPEMQCMNEKGALIPGALCPSRPENQQWLRDGAKWLFTNLPDIGGINLENGDFMTCFTPDCVAARANPANDPNCFWDMQESQNPILDVAKEMRPDGWMTFASYVGFTEEAARGVAKTTVYPPKFINQMPDNAICQWTYTKMTTDATWPAGAVPPSSNFKDEIGLLHHGSIWGSPSDPQRWWAGPGAWIDEYVPVTQFVCKRIGENKLGGLVITGQTGVQSPAHELNYLALEYFGWHPDRSQEQFFQERLAYCYGGEDRARTFLALLRETTRDGGKIRADAERARIMAGQDDLDVRQRARWRNLTDELMRRIGELEKADAEQQQGAKQKPGAQTVILPRGAQDGWINLSSGELTLDGPMLQLGKAHGKGCIVLGIHTLPVGTLPQDILEATLILPRTDNPLTQDTSASGLSFHVEHIDPQYDTQVSAADGSSAALDRLGTYRAAGPLALDHARNVKLDVLDAVRIDLESGRASFAWRIAPEAISDSISSQFYLPSVENKDEAFPVAVRGARLVLRVRYALQP